MIDDKIVFDDKFVSLQVSIKMNELCYDCSDDSNEMSDDGCEFVNDECCVKISASLSLMDSVESVVNEDDDVVVETPFWFNNEESDHVRFIWKSYMDYLNVNFCRSLTYFIGSVERQQVRHHDEFITLDTVKTYLLDPLCPLGGYMPYRKSYMLLTHWNCDGEPTLFEDLTGDEALLAFWEKKMFQVVSFIQCHPVWQNEYKYEYSVSNTLENDNIGYAGEPFNYTKYILQRIEETKVKQCKY